MKKQLKWFIVPCVATMFGGRALSLHAQDEPKVKRNLSVVIHHAEDEVDAKSIRDKVAKELANSGISEETKARILKEVEDALGKSKEAVKKAKKAIEKDVERATTDAKNAVEETKIEIRKHAHSPEAFTTQFFVSPKNDGFRIGIQCSQAVGEDEKEVPQSAVGIEVKAVVDDSPAKKAGIEVGDILMSVNGSKITKIVDLTSAVQEAGKAEKDVSIELKRGEKELKIAVKPTKMKSSDIELEDIRLSLPTGGFVVEGEPLKHFQEQMKKWGPGNSSSGGAQVWNLQSDSASLKKDMDELKSELAELKKMIKGMVDKK